MSAGSGRRRWLLPVATLLLLALGTAAVAVALTLAVTESDDTSVPAGAAPTDTPSTGIPALTGDTPTSSTSGADGPVAELADPAWVAATARTAEIPERALAAYAGAAIAVGRTQPNCGIGWNTLAAIGLVESEHGSIGKASLDASGTARPPIIGVALDGDRVAAIRDTDGGRLDRDPTWDRAVGPMQFIPATWAAHATDANGDGDADIQNIDDAALTAAIYLCSTGGDLTQPDPWIAAVTAYNPDRGYNARVAEAASTYAAASSG